MSPMRHLVRLGQAISDWPVESQQQARRNAMVAVNACAHRRAEREEVASYLADKASRGNGTAARPASAVHA